MRLYRNWPAICAITDPRLKLCVALATDEKVLEGLQRGFPELFTEEKPEHDGPWPLSVLRRVVEAHRGPLHETLEKHFGLPHIKGWELGGAHSPSELPEGGVLLTEDEASSIWSARSYPGFHFPKDIAQVTVGGIKYYVGWVQDFAAPTECCLFPCSLVVIDT